MTPQREAEIRERLTELKARGVDLARVFRRITWTPEDGLRHLEEFLDDMRLLREDFQRSKPQVAKP